MFSQGSAQQLDFVKMFNVHVGIPPDSWEGWENRSIHFHNFSSLPSKKDVMVQSPQFNCFRNKWRLQVYPGGSSRSKSGMVSIFLLHDSQSEIVIEFALSVENMSGGEIFRHSCTKKFAINESWGWNDCVLRSELNSSNVLEHGSLTVKVLMKLDSIHHCKNFIPKNPFVQNMLQLFLDEDTADVSFQVQDKVFPAHKLVLKVCAKESILANLCDDCDESSPLPLPDVEPDVFRKVLRYVYGGIISASKWKDCAKDLIEAADKYGLKSLKIEAEAWYVKYLTFEVESVADTLVYAESKNCFLLKEAAIKFIVTNASAVLSSDSLRNIPESKSIIREIIFSIATTSKQDNAVKQEVEDLAKLSISDLRARLHAEGENIDGSKETLIDRLK